ncbi:MAG: DHH family phosphoesterase [Spirochaetes bacterium]|nr:DHH family phosphoesterase [Spirochaetota bacterium]
MKEYAKSLRAALAGQKRILIVIQGSPDPDAMASSFVFHKICEYLGIRTTIVANKRLSLPVNRAFVKILDMPIQFVKSIPTGGQYDSYAIMDHQQARVEGLAISCSVHIDHHEPLKEQVPAAFRLIDEKAGSTCTIIALIMKSLELPIQEPDMTAIATALLYGILTDTDKYAYAHDRDFRALDYISGHSDGAIIRRLSDFPVSRETVELIGRANDGKIEYRDWLIAGLGYLNASLRDSIPLVADFLLKQNEEKTVVVFAAVEDTGRETLVIDASFRSRNEHLDLNGIIKEITPEGGARRFKGAYQVPIHYFYRAPDRERLWEIISATTVEVLKRRRDAIYITELKGFYRRMKDAVRDFFSGNERP